VELDLEEAGWARLRHALAARRLLAHVVPTSGMLILSPPLCIDEGDLRRGVDQVRAAIEEATA
jgi:adenosylmethionine-8-amino-7-oxononanoate aminotransferase